jgi:hypothetical protein
MMGFRRPGRLMLSSRKLFCYSIHVLYADFWSSAGGGGNTQERRQKIEGKNQKLNEERFRRIQEEEKAKLEKKEGGPIDESAIHPSRRGRVQV